MDTGALLADRIRWQKKYQDLRGHISQLQDQLKEKQWYGEQLRHRLENAHAAAESSLKAADMAIDSLQDKLKEIKALVHSLTEENDVLITPEVGRVLVKIDLITQTVQSAVEEKR